MLLTDNTNVMGNHSKKNDNLQCSLCGCSSLRYIFTEFNKDNIPFSNYYCSKCDLYQSIGNVSAISPDYIVLTESDIDKDRLWLQSGHKRSAFYQWSSLMEHYTPKVNSHNTKSVLDVGCGVGGFLDYAASQGYRTYGYDASRAQVQRANRSHESVRCCSDIMEYVSEFRLEHRLDYITMWDVFEHIRKPNQILSGIRVCLTSNGLVFISVPNGAVTIPRIMMARFLGKAPGLIPWEHVFYYTKISLRKVLENNGFYVKEIGGVLLYPRPIGIQEIARRIGHSLLRHSMYALQIYAIASPKPS